MFFSGKLKGTFVLRNGLMCNYKQLYRNSSDLEEVWPYCIQNRVYRSNGKFGLKDRDSLDIVDFIPYTDMKDNELTIEIPDGKIVDWDESKKQNKIVLKDKQLTYADVCKKLFDKEYYLIGGDGVIRAANYAHSIQDINNAPTVHQLECLLAKNKLANVAKCLNDGWKPSGYIFGWFICACGEELEIRDRNDYKFNNNIIFKSKELAQQAIEILGEETVKLALEPLGV